MLLYMLYVRIVVCRQRSKALPLKWGALHLVETKLKINKYFKTILPLTST